MITIDIPERDYELSVIVRLIEQDGARIHGVMVDPPMAEGQPYRVGFHLNVADESRVASSLRRFGFDVVKVDNESENDADWLRRAESFLRYLDM